MEACEFTALGQRGFFIFLLCSMRNVKRPHMNFICVCLQQQAFLVRRLRTLQAVISQSFKTLFTTQRKKISRHTCASPCLFLSRFQGKSVSAVTLGTAASWRRALLASTAYSLTSFQTVAGVTTWTRLESATAFVCSISPMR
jgi:hypothetical protein